MATATVKLKVSLDLNGRDEGVEIDWSIASVASPYVRNPITVTTSGETVLGLGAADEKGQIVGDNLKLLVIQNTDGTNFVEVQLKTSADTLSFKLLAGELLVVSGNQVDAPSGATTFVDMTSVKVIADTASCDVLVYALAT